MTTKFDSSNKPVVGPSEEVEDAVYSLFLVPPKCECNARTLDRAANGEEGFVAIFVGLSNNFLTQKDKFLA